jgi:hypothetical protein
MGWILHLSTYYQMRVDSCSYAPSCQAPKATASRGSERAMLIHCGKPLLQTGGEILFAHANCRVEK